MSGSIEKNIKIQKKGCWESVHHRLLMGIFSVPDVSNLNDKLTACLLPLSKPIAAIVLKCGLCIEQQLDKAVVAAYRYRGYFL
jgi:hypothetical protein